MRERQHLCQAAHCVCRCLFVKTAALRHKTVIEGDEGQVARRVYLHSMSLGAECINAVWGRPHFEAAQVCTLEARQQVHEARRCWALEDCMMLSCAVAMGYTAGTAGSPLASTVKKISVKLASS